MGYDQEARDLGLSGDSTSPVSQPRKKKETLQKFIYAYKGRTLSLGKWVHGSYANYCGQRKASLITIMMHWTVIIKEGAEMARPGALRLWKSTGGFKPQNHMTKILS